MYIFLIFILCTDIYYAVPAKPVASRSPSVHLQHEKEDET
jgi:hypothetical protein